MEGAGNMEGVLPVTRRVPSVPCFLPHSVSHPIVPSFV